MLSHNPSHSTFGRRSATRSIVTRRPRRAYFCFHYERDLARVRLLLDTPNVLANAAAGFQSTAFWERIRRRGEAAVHAAIDSALENTTVTVVCLGRWTSNGKFIDYELERSLSRGNGLLGVRINHLRDEKGTLDDPGAAPALFNMTDYSVHDYAGPSDLANRIEEAARRAGC